MPLTRGSTTKGPAGPDWSVTLKIGKKGKEAASAGKLEIDKDAFTPVAQEDFMRVDSLCSAILLNFYEQLQAEGLSPEEATELAKGADYFIRDFVVDFKAINLFHEHPGIVRQFAGNWYINNTLEPDIRQLGGYLQGIRAFYRFLHDNRLISTGFLENIEKECADLAYYEGRIESFWEIEGDGYIAWEMGCTLKDGHEKTGRA
jgi:hypothetical protein